MNKLLTTLFLIFITLPGFTQVVQITDDLIPLQTGNLWKYQINSNSLNTLTECVYPEVEINDGGLTNIHTKPVVDDSALEPTTTYYVVDQSSGLEDDEVLLARVLSEGERWTINPPLPLAIYETGSLNVPARFLGDGQLSVLLDGETNSVGGISYTSDSAVVAVNEMVEVPAGMFETIRIETEIVINGQLPGEPPMVDKTENRIYWFAMGVGVVKRTITDEDGSETVELLSYTVNAEPQTTDTDEDEIIDACDEDDDNDQVIDEEDAFPLDPTESIDTDNDEIGNNADEDDDGDSMPDEFEINNNLDPLDAADGTADRDDDGLTNIEEYLLGTDIDNPDSDSDGTSDGDEVAEGGNPLVNEAVIILLINSSDN